METPGTVLSFRRLSLLVLSSCIILTGGLVYGLRLLFPYEASVLTNNPCSLPCFYGVTPGEISRLQAAAIYAGQHPLIRVTEDPMVFTLLDAHRRDS